MRCSAATRFFGQWRRLWGSFAQQLNNSTWLKQRSHCARHQTTALDSLTHDIGRHTDTGRCRPVSSDVVRCRPATYMQIICKYTNNMAADVADIVVASATFLYVFEEENDEKERRRRIRRRLWRFWIHDVNHRREVCDKVGLYAWLKKAPCPV